MSDTTVAIFGTAQEISWGDVPVDMLSALLEGEFDEDELRDEVLSQNSETSLLLNECVYSIAVDNEEIEAEFAPELLSAPLKNPTVYEHDSDTGYFVVEVMEFEGLIRAIPNCDGFNLSQFSFQLEECQLSGTGHTIEVFCLEYGDYEDEPGEGYGFATLKLYGPDGFVRDLNSDPEEANDAPDESDVVERTFVFAERDVFERYKAWADEKIANGDYVATDVEVSERGQEIYMKLVGTYSDLDYWAGPHLGWVEEEIGHFTDSWDED